MLGVKISTLIKSMIRFRNFFDYILFLKGLSRKRKAVLKTRDGLKIIIRNNIWDARIVAEVFLSGVYIKNINISPHSPPVVVDVGAYIGDFALYAAKYLNAHVIAYEPIQENFGILLENIKINDLEDKIKPWNKAIGLDTSLVLNVTKKEDEIHASSFMYSDTGERITVESGTLEDVFNENKINKIDILKIDCEGCEYDVLLNSPNKVFQRIKNIVFEYHEILNHEEKLFMIFKKLKEAGYKVITNQHIVTAVK